MTEQLTPEACREYLKAVIDPEIFQNKEPELEIDMPRPPPAPLKKKGLLGWLFGA